MYISRTITPIDGDCSSPVYAPCFELLEALWAAWRGSTSASGPGAPLLILRVDRGQETGELAVYNTARRAMTCTEQVEGL